MSDENSPSKSFSIPEFRQSEASIAQKANVAEQMATQRSNEQVMRTERIGNNSVCRAARFRPIRRTRAGKLNARPSKAVFRKTSPSNSCSARLPSPWKEIP